ncbi:hypothetical protein [Paracoccus sp. (in: a-proteobacteria)]|uniref:hypothetical protein n=1 Tax=Paracoccus sp. TaxID=267 RepID=UPI0026DFC9D5|nr:hypothetical protein [Paracoccus sp. (in: a-proteobacteria)]MDO5648857.1 hypothetical protein [Paracoccus sp. (in: a-proteobacteria)]
MPKTDDLLPMQVNAPAARFANPVAAGAVIRGGAMVALDAAGNAVPAAAASPVMRGIALDRADNGSGSAGAVHVGTSRGVWIVKNDGTVKRTHIGKSVYVKDDETVAATGTLIAGRCLDVTDGGVAVEFI